MKKISAHLLAMMMVLSLAACGGGKAPKPSGNSGSGDTSPAATQQETTAPETDTNQKEQLPPPNKTQEESLPQEQTGASDSMEALAEACCLPGLTAPDGCTFERGTLGIMEGVAFSKEDDFTSDEHKAVINSVWALCQELSPDGNYDVKNSGNTNTITETYSAITDKYAEYNEASLTDYELYWHYTYNGRVRQVKILGGNPIRVVTADMGTLEAQ